MFQLRSLIGFLFFISCTSGILGEPVQDSIDLDDGKYALNWWIDYEAETIAFQIEVETKGFVGFGISQDGTMNGADIVIGGVNGLGEQYFMDRHGTEHEVPVIDTEQNYKMENVYENDTHTVLIFSRAFDTEDDEDVALTTEEAYFIWSYGQSDTIEYHEANRGVHKLTILNPPQQTETPGTETPETETPETETPGTETPETETPGTETPETETPETETPGTETPETETPETETPGTETPGTETPETETPETETPGTETPETETPETETPGTETPETETPETETPEASTTVPTTTPPTTTTPTTTRPTGSTTRPTTGPTGSTTRPTTGPTGSTTRPTTGPTGSTTRPTTGPTGSTTRPTTGPTGSTTESGSNMNTAGGSFFISMFVISMFFNN